MEMDMQDSSDMCGCIKKLGLLFHKPRWKVGSMALPVL